MADLIDRQKIKARFEPWLNVKGYSEGELNIIRAVLYEITIMPSAQPEPRWIPCSERLPEERQEILATTTDNAWGDVVIIRTYYKEMHKSVIAWMPLPEPYKDGEQDG